MGVAKNIKEDQPNFLLRIHPLHRIGISTVIAAVVWLLLRNKLDNDLLIIISTWSAFALSYLITSWTVLFGRKVSELKKVANKDDGSRIFVLLFTVITSFAALVTVLLIIVGADKNEGNKLSTVLVGFSSVVFSWLMVHTILTFHYAHLYYDDDEDDNEENKEVGGLKFPGNEEPGYLDFAYFSFVVGMTFQVSDVQVENKKIRRLVLGHALISFLLNTFVVALTINFIAGLSK